MSCVGTSSRPLALPTVSLTLRVTTAAARWAEPGFRAVPCAGGAGARGGFFFGFFGGFGGLESKPICAAETDRLAVHENLVVRRRECGEPRLRAEGWHCCGGGGKLPATGSARTKKRREPVNDGVNGAGVPSSKLH